MGKKLTRAQQAAWEAIKYLVSQGKQTWRGWYVLSNGDLSAGYGTGVSPQTLKGIERAGYIKLHLAKGREKDFSLTEAGYAEIAPEPEAVFEAGDKVLVARKGINLKSDEKFHAREIGTVLPSPDYKPGYIRVQFSDIVMVYVSPDELELWKPDPAPADWSAIAAATFDGLKSEDELRQEVEALKAENEKLKRALETLTDYIGDNALVLDLPMGLRLRAEAAVEALNGAAVEA